MKTILLGLLTILTLNVFAQRLATFELNQSIILDGISSGEVKFADMNNDGNMDIIYSGQANSTTPITRLYINDGTGSFNLKENSGLPNLRDGSLALGDVDNDNDIDVVISGFNETANTSTYLCINDGTGIFSIHTYFYEDVVAGSIELADIDNDSDLDIIITGLDTDDNYFASVKKNDGAGNFTFSQELTPVFNSKVKFADIDNDQDLDLLLTGRNEEGSRVSEMYVNDGNGNFTVQPNTPFTHVENASIQFIDIDNDNDLDLFILGVKNYNPKEVVSELYTNDGEGNFSLVQGTNFLEADFGFARFADIDNDNDLDLFISGLNIEYYKECAFYLNDGSGSFSEATYIDIPAQHQASADFTDLNGDNFPELVISGYDEDEEVYVYNNVEYDGVSAVNLEDTNDLHIFPNPANDFLHINIHPTSERIKIEIINSFGIVALHQTVNQNNGNVTISIADLSPGVYFVKINGLTQKFIKN
jgi:hypothetical protein